MRSLGIADYDSTQLRGAHVRLPLANSVSISRMISKHFCRAHARKATLLLAAGLILLLNVKEVSAATWKGLEPFVSKRADVEAALGEPIQDRLAQDGALKFNIPDGTVTVFFVTPKFVAAKKLSPALEGTVLQIVLQHDRAAETPESLNLVKNSAFKREARAGTAVFKNEKGGIVYTFVDSRLKTTRYTYSSDQLARMQKGK